MIKGSYWDIDDILAEEEPVNIKIAKDLEGVGFINPSANTINLKESLVISTPLWLGLSMAVRELATVEIPKFYAESYRNTLKADPRIISLKDRSNYFFDAALKLNTVLAENELKKLLLKVFFERFLYIFSELTHNSDAKIIKKLTEMELEIYEKGMKTLRELQEWRERKHERLSNTNTAPNSKKFKLK